MNLIQKQANDESLSTSYDLADFSFEADGSINVAFTNYDVSSSINIYKVIFIL
jgi:hypothetical protein